MCGWARRACRPVCSLVCMHRQEQPLQHGSMAVTRSSNSSLLQLQPHLPVAAIGVAGAKDACSCHSNRLASPLQGFGCAGIVRTLWRRFCVVHRINQEGCPQTRYACMQGLLYEWQAAAAESAYRLPSEGMRQARLPGAPAADVASKLSRLCCRHSLHTGFCKKMCMPCYLSMHCSSSCPPTFSQMECRQLAAPAVPHHSCAPQVQPQAQLLLLLGPGRNLRQKRELQSTRTPCELIEAHKQHGRPGICKPFTRTVHTLPARTSAAVVRMGKMPASYCTTA